MQVVRLVAVGLHLLHIEQQVGLAVRTDLASLMLKSDQARVPRGTRQCHAGAGVRIEHARLQIHAAAKRGLADGGGTTRTAVHDRTAQELRGEEDPRMVADAIGVVERNAFKAEHHIAVGQAAHGNLGIAQAHAVG